MSSTLKIQSIKFTFRGGRNVQYWIESLRKRGTFILQNEIVFFMFVWLSILNLLAPELFFLILAHAVYKVWIIQEANKLELWNKLHFKEKKTESILHV
jgi:hypothetical protein